MRLLRLSISAATFLLLAECASTTAGKSPIIEAYVRADYAIAGTPSNQYANFSAGDVVHCSSETKPGFRVEWLYDGKLRSKEAYFQFQPWKSGELKLYVFDSSAETGSAPSDSASWDFKVR